MSWKPRYQGHALKEKSTPLILLIALAFLALVTCAQQEQTPSKGSPPKKAAPQKAPVKMQYLTGEVLSVNKAKKTILIRGKDRDLSFHTDSKTSIKIDGKPKRLADVTAGKKVAIRYIEDGDKNIVRSLVISALPPEKKTSPEAPAKTDVPAGNAAVQP
jgi:ABC-type Fe3+-hydroxamate transport system substrate-binding protein